MNRRKDKKLLRMVLNEVLRQKAFGGQEIRWLYSLGIGGKKCQREHGESLEYYCDKIWKYWKYNLR
jgi:hypothetical protein